MSNVIFLKRPTDKRALENQTETTLSQEEIKKKQKEIRDLSEQLRKLKK
jgi:hypothetical protein